MAPAKRSQPACDDTGDGPRFSVVIPAYNEAEFVGACLESLAKQDYTGHYEVIVVDNNSTDQTADIARSHGAQVVREENPGVCWARQCGTLQAVGEIVISTDADTTFHQGWLSRIDQAFASDPHLVAIAGPCHFVDAPWWGHIYTWSLFGAVRLLRRLTGNVYYITATNIAFRRSEWPGYDTRATQGGDELGLLRRLRSRGKVAFDPGNPTFTSSRRLYRGLAYNFFATFFFYYLVGYGVNKLAGRPVVGTAPAFRGGAPSAAAQWRVERRFITALCLALCVVVGGVATYMVRT